METKPCKIDGCKRKILAKKLCGMHYSRIRNGIKDMRPGPIPWSDDDPRLKKNKNLKCGVTNCKEKYYAKGYCRTHYNLNRNNGRPEYKRNFLKPPCKVLDCENKYYAKGFCSFHYGRHRSGVDLDMPKRTGTRGKNNGMWKGGIFRYPDHYKLKKNRLKVLESSNWICKYCGKRADRVHHRDKTKYNHKIENLAPSCAKCNSQRMSENRRSYLTVYGISARIISEKFGLTINEINHLHDNGLLKGIINKTDSMG